MDLDLLSGYRSRFLNWNQIVASNSIPLSVSGINTFPEERYQLNCCSTCEVLKINGLPAVFVFKGIYREGKHPDDFLEVVLSYIKDISGNLIDGCFRLTDAECFDEYEELPWENIFFETECVSTCQECVPNPEPAPFITNHKIIYPDFKVNNVDPYKAEQIFCEFGNAFYEKALALKFGVQFCCPTDLMQSTIEHEILKMEIVEDKYACCKDKNPCANCSPTQTHLPDLPPCTPSNGPWSYTNGPWSSWSTCTNLSQTRTRIVTGTRQCILPYCNTYTEISKSTETQTQACCLPSCSAWTYTYTVWSAWSTCVNGSQIRTRTANGSRTCTLADCSTNIETSTAIETETQSCTCTTSCGGWTYSYSLWSAWSTCVGGLQSRTRTVNGSRTCILADCSTNIETSSNIESESQACTCTTSCGAWSYTYTAWSAWDTCVGGTQSRTRTANGTRTCILADCSTNIETSSNIETETQSCTCATSCGEWVYTYTAWSEWSTCVSSSQSRTRTANGSRTCILADCSTNIETSTTTETESQACVVPCLDCIAHDLPPIGTQTWSGCNLDVDRYRNGDLIPYVEDSIAWAALTTGAWCWYANTSANGPIYGKLYNWHAVNDPRGLAPVGYHVPTDSEWTVLTDYLGGLTIAGGKLKEQGFCHWDSPNTDATNTSLFTALPGGFRYFNGAYSGIGGYGHWWSSTEVNTGDAWNRTLSYNIGNAFRNNDYKKDGMSVRLIKDDPTCPNCSPNVVTIGTQTWTGCNANVSTYRDGTLIPYVEDAAAWAALTTGAWCYVNGDPTTEATYGKLYNWRAVNNTANGGLAPVGYHVPTDPEFTILANFLGGQSVAGGKMKEQGFCHWDSPNVGATNSSLFTVLPAGYRTLNGSFTGLRGYAWLWSATLTNFDKAYGRVFGSYDDDAAQSVNFWNQGHSVRFIKD